MLKRLGIVAAAVIFAGCATYDGPPEVTIVGEVQGQLTDTRAPIVLSFSKAPRPETVRIKLARFDRDDEGNLPDETDPPGELSTLFTHDPEPDLGDTGGTSELSADGLTVTIALDTPPPVGRQLVLLIEPGMEDASGVATKVRRRIPLTYASPLTCNAPASVVKSGAYFFMAGVTVPVATQVKLWTVIEVNQTTGGIQARFTKAKRNPDLSRCPGLTCGKGEVCRTVPQVECVAPSAPAGSVDEFVDYVIDTDPLTGFGFETTGCAVDQGAAMASFATAPVDVQVTSPKVTLRNASLSAAFSPDSMGVLRGTGSLVADAVLLGTFDSGMGQGDLTARSLSPDETPADLPAPE